jgi:hypothetical protein
MAYQVYTLAQMRVFLQEKVESVPFWVNEEATDAINEALLMWNSLTGFWKTDISQMTTPNSFEYAVDPGIVFGTRVEFNGIPLAESSLTDMDNGQPGWQGQTTLDGGNVPTQPRNWLPLSVDIIAIWPADALGHNTLKIFGVSQTPRLVDDTDFINIGSEALNAILGYSLHVLALKEGGERFAATLGLFTDFLKQAAEENDQLFASSLFRQLIGTDVSRQMKQTRGIATDYDAMGQRSPTP